MHITDDLAVLVPADAHVEHGGARLHVLRLDDVRHARRGHDDVGLTQLRGQVAGSGVTLRDRGVLGLPRQQQRDGAADGDAAADHDHMRAVDLHAVVTEQLDDAVRGAGQRAALVQHQSAEAHGVQPVGVLGRVHQLQDAVGVDALGERELDDVAGALGVVVELPYDRLDLLLRGGVGQLALDGGDADLGAVAVLACDVPLAARVVADEEGAQAGRDALGLQRFHADGEFGLDRGCGGLAIENLGGHGPILADGAAVVPIRSPATPVVVVVVASPLRSATFRT